MAGTLSILKLRFKADLMVICLLILFTGLSFGDELAGYQVEVSSKPALEARCWRRLTLSQRQEVEVLSAIRDARASHAFDASAGRQNYFKRIRNALTPEQFGEISSIKENRKFLSGLRSHGGIIEFPENEISVVRGFLDP